MSMFKGVLSFMFGALLLASPSVRADQGADCRKVRKVACPAKCNADEEEKPATKQCIFSKEKYKEDDIGCVKYVDVCWCGPPCPKESGDIKL